MCSNRFSLFLLFAALLWPAAGQSQPGPVPPMTSDAGFEAWLVTYGPGDIYWQRFGHNALWLREPAAGLDHSFNFGYFDFEQENFLLRFVQGRMLYFSLAQPAAREQAYYAEENRTIRFQRLDLDVAQYVRLRDHLLAQVQPENRHYLYDYYLDNCSTRIRDALDVALAGELSARTTGQPARQNFRQHTRRSTVSDYWYYLGLEIGLGQPVDRVISRWEEMFLPQVVADEIGSLSAAADAGQPLVASETWFTPPGAPVMPEQAEAVWPRYLALALGALALGWLLSRLPVNTAMAGLALAWLLIAGTLGMMLAALWAWTDHLAASPNLNLMLFNPLMVLALVRPLQRLVAVLVATGSLLALAVSLLTAWQYNADVLALVLPINLVCALGLWRGWFLPHREGSYQSSTSR